MTSDVLVVGSSWQNVSDETDLQLDELVFETTSRALKSAGLSRHQVNLAIISSLDLYDGRSISNALTAPAAGGYLNEEFRVEGDAMASIFVAVSALIAGEVECAIVVGLHVPEIGTTAERALRRFREQVSSYTFDAHCDRPVGMTSEVTLGMHAALRIEDGSGDLNEYAERSSADIQRGANKRGVRTSSDAESVKSSCVAVDPLTELMLPATSAGLGAVILAGGVLGRRCAHPQARVTGWGMATTPGTSSASWLNEPARASALAAAKAYGVANIAVPGESVGVLEMTDLSPALSDEVLAALQLNVLEPEHVNQSGGVRSNFPGNANGLLRVVEATDALGISPSAETAVAHSVDDLSGLVTSTATVLVLERP